MPATGTDPTGLPLRCYARHPTTDETIMLIRGQLGFWPAGTSMAPEQMNAGLGDRPTPAQAQAMLTGSMFGWHVPGADPGRVPATRHAVTANPDLVIDWGALDRPFVFAGLCPIAGCDPSAPDRLWTHAAAHLGFYGWLRVANAHAARSCKWVILDLLDLPPRDWRGEYDGRVPPREAADVAIDEHESMCGIQPQPAIGTQRP